MSIDNEEDEEEEEEAVRRNGDDYGKELAGKDGGNLSRTTMMRRCRPAKKGKPSPLTRRRSLAARTKGKPMSPKTKRGGAAADDDGAVNNNKGEEPAVNNDS